MTNEKLSQRSTYSLAQNATAEDGLPFLTVLTKYQLAGIPFENLELHYSPHHIISLDPQHLLHKMIERGTNRGGYCTENNCLFGTVLRSLGFNVYSVGARASDAVQPVAAAPGRSGPKYDGWSHMLNIFTINGQKYGGCWLRRQWFAYRSTAPQLSQQTSACRRTGCYVNLWCFDHSNDGGLIWTPTYAFTDVEFLP
ncbi:hypothetical protein V1504DRAFT_471998 [Lipomyces starkeyi]